VPDDSALVTAAAHVATTEARLAEAEDRLTVSRRALVAAEEAVRQALRTLTTLAARHQLPTTATELDDVADALTHLERTAEVWARRRRDLIRAERQWQRAAEDAERAAARCVEALAHLADSQREAAEVEVKVAALESAVGSDYREVLDRLAGLEDQRRRLQARSREVTAARPALERRLGVLESDLVHAEATRVQADDHRAWTHQRFAAAVTDGLVHDGGVGVPDAADGVTAVLSAARSVAADLGDVAADAQTVKRLSGRVEERLYHAQAALGGRVDLSRDLADEGWWVLRAASGGLRRAVAELAAVVAAELDAGRAELAADEERLFEQTLAGSVRHALADRIRLANGLVDGINVQLGAVRTAAGGVQVRLRWDVDPDQPEIVKAARGLLLRDPASLSDAERAALCDFVRMRVDQARLDVEANAPWEARLRETLDYRAWHRFALELAHRDWEGFKPATSRRLGQLSTGERSIVLHLPMLASIAAHYTDDSGAASCCPRLILLDELFAGVDTANRAQLFGTFTEWELDAVLTSDHEWCQYAALDGVAIHHLHPAVGDGPVTSTRFTWDGRQRLVDPSAA
ncbi:MAG: SbcC/MukB-like Walker B domain-containing protein, partial [Acidimicrobiia bacterium]